MDYFNEDIDQLELARRMKLLRRKTGDGYRYEGARQPEPLMKLLLKYSAHNNLELLRRLALANNPKVLACYDQYLGCGDEEQFAENITRPPTTTASRRTWTSSSSSRPPATPRSSPAPRRVVSPATSHDII